MIAVAKNDLSLDDERTKLLEHYAHIPQRVVGYLKKRFPWLRHSGADIESVANAAFLVAAEQYRAPGSFVAFAGIVIRRGVLRADNRSKKMLGLSGDPLAPVDQFADLREAMTKLPLPVRKAVERHFGMTDGPIERLCRRDEAALIAEGLEQLRVLMG